MIAALAAARPANQVWIGNVPFHFRAEDVIESFKQHNFVQPIYVDIRRGTREENYCFAYFSTQAEADATINLPKDSLRFPGGKHALIKVVVFFVLCAGMVRTRPEGLFGPIL